MDPNDAIAGALATLGPWGAIAGLAWKLGAPFVGKIIENAANKTPVTPEEWAKLEELIETPGESLIPKRPAP